MLNLKWQENPNVTWNQQSYQNELIMQYDQNNEAKSKNSKSTSSGDGTPYSGRVSNSIIENKFQKRKNIVYWSTQYKIAII